MGFLSRHKLGMSLTSFPISSHWCQHFHVNGNSSNSLLNQKKSWCLNFPGMIAKHFQQGQTSKLFPALHEQISNFMFFFQLLQLAPKRLMDKLLTHYLKILLREPLFSILMSHCCVSKRTLFREHSFSAGEKKKAQEPETPPSAWNISPNIYSPSCIIGFL